MADQIEIRRATPNDYDALADVMFDAVRHGASQYTEAQREAWLPRPRSGASWAERLNAQIVYVAARSTHLSGFMSLATDGYIDLAFIRPSDQGSGVFRRLYAAIETASRNNGATRLWVHASLMAQAPFAAMGFSIIKQETVEVGGQFLDRFKMEKHC